MRVEFGVWRAARQAFAYERGDRPAEPIAAPALQQQDAPSKLRRRVDFLAARGIHERLRSARKSSGAVSSRQQGEWRHVGRCLTSERQARYPQELQGAERRPLADRRWGPE